MPIDFALNPRTGDWVLTGNMDYQNVSGVALVSQRITVRLKIDRGKFIYDRTGTLGSRLRSAGTRQQRDRVLNELKLYVEEALEPMNDIEIKDIQIDQPEEEDKEVKVHIFWRPVANVSELTGLSRASTTQATIVSLPI